MSSSAQGALERRRVRNREAQRRFREKRSLQKAASSSEAQSDLYSSASLFVQSPGLSLGDNLHTRISDSPVNCAAGSFEEPSSSYCNSFLSDDISFPEDRSVLSTLEPNLSFSVSTPSSSPTSSKAVESVRSSFVSNSGYRGSFARGGQQACGLVHRPPDDCTSSLSGDTTHRWLGPLHMAAQKGQDRIVRALLQHSIDCNERDSDGLTPLMHAVIGGHADVVQSLLMRGASIGNFDGQQCPSAVHLAVLHRRENLLGLLLNHCLEDRALLDSYDHSGKSPLHVAIDTDFEAGVLMLLQFGADPQRRTRRN